MSFSCSSSSSTPIWWQNKNTALNKSDLEKMVGNAVENSVVIIRNRVRDISIKNMRIKK